MTGDVMFGRFLYKLFLALSRVPRWLKRGFVLLLLILPFAGILGAWLYQNWDDRADRGALAIAEGAFGESYATPEYLDQGWDAADSLRFYNTTQGSALLPYDFLLALEQTDLDDPTVCERGGDSGAWFLCDRNIDRYRYLPQVGSFFNPDALPVGFVKETYQDKDYVGFTCAACHTGQVNFQGRALRIDGGPAMADMLGFMDDLTRAMKRSERKAEGDNTRFERFAERVIALGNDYDSADAVADDLAKWSATRELYNIVNTSTYNGQAVDYGYARLDAFGRIYNRILQHAINRDNVAATLRSVTRRDGTRLLDDAGIDKVLAEIPDDNIVLRDAEFTRVLANLRSSEPGYPGLELGDLLLIRDAIFNSPNAPVSYPFLWDTTRSDYVQWNGLANNATLGPLGRNTGEVVGVFAILDWHKKEGFWARMKRFSLSAMLSGQDRKANTISFQSSVDLFNLRRLESQLNDLMSPRWPFCRKAGSGEHYLPEEPADQAVDRRPCAEGDTRIDAAMAERGKLVYDRACLSCHQLLDRDDWDRVAVSFMVGTGNKQSTDPAMAQNSVNYGGKSGNFKDTYQTVDKVGDLVVKDEAPAAQMLSAAVKGTLGTADVDKWWPRRLVDWLYSVALSLSDNPIKGSIKEGNYQPSSVTSPYNSLLAYRARPLNGIWATAPYLHNGSVPTLYDLLLPAEAKAKCPEARPESFRVGRREFDPDKVGFASAGTAGFRFRTELRGNRNSGHEYGACGMTDAERADLIEYLKAL